MMLVIDQCSDAYGLLSDKRKALLEQLLRAPDQQLWSRSRRLVIRAVPLLTLENAVKAVKKQVDITQAPDPFTLYRALRYAINYGSNGAESGRGGICR